MVIGIDASRANNQKKTGVEWYAFHIIQGLKKTIDNDVSVVLYSREPLVGPLARLPKNWSSKVLEWKPRFLWTHLRLGFELVRNCPDVLFVPAHVPPLFCPKNTITMIHDVAARDFPESYSWFQRWYTLWSARHALSRLSAVIVPSVFTKKKLLDMVGPKHAARLVVIPHGYDQSFLPHKTKDAEVRVRKKYQIKERYVLCVGRQETKKNTVRLVQAFNRVKRLHEGNPIITKLHLVLVGSSGFGYAHVTRAIAGSRYKDDIHSLGWVPQEDLAVLMRAAHVFALPSLSEGFGMPVLEAFAAETVPVVSRGSSFEEVGGLGALYVDPLDIGSIANVLYKAVVDEKARIQCKELGKQRLAEYSWQRAAESTAKLLT